MSVKVTRVEERSLGAELGIQPGDTILSVGGRPIRDIIDLRFHTAEDRFVLRLQKAAVSGAPGEVWEMDLEPAGEDLGVEIEDFRNKGCNNKCIFCFVDQLPPGVRRPLLFKDDDFRLSFLHGNYVTLTNLRPAEIERIIEQRLSPLYVSVHATDPEVRNRMLGRSTDGGFQEKFERLLAGGIRLHAQVVLCPTYNDGPVLKQTVFDLYRRHPGVATVSIVPLGLSKHRSSRDGLAPVTPHFCRQVIEQAAAYQEEFRRRSGATFAHLADEFYLMAGHPIPPAWHYDDFPLTEDGIGMVRLFAGEFSAHLRKLPGRGSLTGLCGALVTGTLFEPVLRTHVEALNEESGSRLQVFSVANDFLGETITVAGLLAGRDIARRVRGKVRGDFLIVPSEAVSNADRVFIDGLTLAALGEAVGVPAFEGGLTVESFFEVIRRLHLGARLECDGSRAALVDSHTGS